MFTIYFSNFGYQAQGAWTSIGDAIAAARGFGFDATIKSGDKVAGFWSIIGGYRPCR